MRPVPLTKNIHTERVVRPSKKLKYILTETRLLLLILAYKGMSKAFSLNYAGDNVHLADTFKAHSQQEKILESALKYV